MNHDRLDRGQDDGGVRVLELRQHSLAYLLGLLGICGPILGHRAEDRYSPPLCALAERHQQLSERGLIDDEDVVLLGRFVNLGERSDRVGDNHRIRIRDEISQGFDEAMIDREAWLEVVELDHTDRRRLAHVRIVVAQTLAQRIGEVVDDLVRPQAAHRPDGQCADERIRILGVLDEGVDGENDELRLRLGVRHQVEIDELLPVDVSARSRMTDCSRSSVCMFCGHEIVCALHAP